MTEVTEAQVRDAMREREVERHTKWAETETTVTLTNSDWLAIRAAISGSILAHLKQDHDAIARWEREVRERLVTQLPDMP